jgi:predicted nucleic acid-binding protein
MIFLDSDILSYYFSGNIKIHQRIRDTISSGEKIALTSISIYEILKGLRWRKNKSKEVIFQKFLENITVFTIDDGIIELAADIYANLRKSGKTIGDADILIAAIVIKNNGKLVSNNAKHYKHIEKLHLINWLE